MKRIMVLTGLIMLISAPSAFSQFDLVEPSRGEPTLTLFAKGDFGPLDATYSSGGVSVGQDGNGSGFELHALLEQPTSPKVNILVYGAIGSGKNTLDENVNFVKTEVSRTAFSIGLGLRIRLK